MHNSAVYTNQKKCFFTEISFRNKMYLPALQQSVTVAQPIICFNLSVTFSPWWVSFFPTKLLWLQWMVSPILPRKNRLIGSYLHKMSSGFKGKHHNEGYKIFIIFSKYILNVYKTSFSKFNLKRGKLWEFNFVGGIFG